MLHSATLVALLIAAIVGVPCPGQRPNNSDGPLVSVTKLITSGNIAAAQQAAKVNPPLYYVPSYAHYLTVNVEYNSNIFFWYFPVTSGDPDAPLLLWLQGGPGTSSLLGVFAEHGPVSIDSNLNPIARSLAWNKRYHMVYFDNPVGAGFSYTENVNGYANNLDDVGDNLYRALIQFLTLFPDLQKKPFFITGESYGGKYVPALGRYIHMNNPNATLKINLQGLAIGNGFADPPNLKDYASHLYETGLVDDHGKRQFQLLEAEIESNSRLGHWEKAAYLASRMTPLAPIQPYASLFTNLTGFSNIYNYLYQEEPVRYWMDYVNQSHIRNALHVYNRTFNDGSAVVYHFREDLLKSVRPWIEELLKSYRVLVYTGQLDILVSSRQVHDYLNKLIFPGRLEYQNAQRSKWMVSSMIAGYVKTGGLLTELVVRNAGHMVPQDQPELGWDLIDRFVNNKSFSES